MSPKTKTPRKHRFINPAKIPILGNYLCQISGDIFTELFPEKWVYFKSEMLIALQLGVDLVVTLRVFEICGRVRAWRSKLIESIYVLPMFKRCLCARIMKFSSVYLVCV